MKSVTIGQRQEVRNSKQASRLRLNQAIGRALEPLENRVMMAAGFLDPSWTAGAGWTMYTQPPATYTDLPPYASPPMVVPTGPRLEGWDTWDGVLPYMDPETVIHDAVVDAGGRLVVVGEQMGNRGYWTGTAWAEYWDRDFSLTRYNTDGTIDHILIPNSPLANLRPVSTTVRAGTQIDDRAFGVVIEPAYLPDGVTPNPLAGQIVLAGVNGAAQYGQNIGRTGSVVALARYSLSSTYQTRTLDNITGGDTPDCYTVTDLAIQAVGNTWKYLVVGSINDPNIDYEGQFDGQNMAIWRFNSNGTLDTSFGTGGMVRVANGGTPFKSTSDQEITAVVVQPDGKILITGYSDDTTWNQQDGHVSMVVARYNANGTADASFGVSGYVEIGDVRAADARANALTLQQDGRIVIAGAFDKLPDVGGPDGSTFDTALVVRLMPNGTLDTTFGSGGRAEISDPAESVSWRAQRLAVQSDGKIVVGGEIGNSFGLVRLTANGRVDTGYGAGDGVAIIGSLPTGFRENRLVNIGGEDWSNAYSYDTPVLVLGNGSDVDKAYIIGNLDANGIDGDSFQYGGYVIARVQGDNTRPGAKAQLSNVSTAGAGVYNFYVTFTDNTSVDRATIASSNVVIVGPGNVQYPATLVSITAQGASDGTTNNRQFVVKYSITPPGGTWNGADNGIYSLRLLTNQVKDIEGTDAVPSPLPYLELGNFTVSIITPDNIAPIASSDDLGTAMTIGGRTYYRFVVKYEDLTADKTPGAGGNISVASLIGNDNVITVTGPNGYVANAQFISIDFATNGTPRYVTYEIPAPSSATGRWSEVDNGTYVFNLNANQVADDYVSANYAQASELGRLKVAIVPGANVYPTAQIISKDSDISDDSDSVFNFSILYLPSAYATGVSIDPTTLINNTNALLVTGSNSAVLPITYVGIQDAPGGGYIVSYSVDATDGMWSLNDNASYTIFVADNSGTPQYQVTDTDVPVGNPLQPVTLGTFVVAVPDKKPTAALAGSPAGNVTTTGKFDITVTYSDDIAIKAGTFGLANIELRLQGGGTVIAPYTFSVSTPGNGSPRTVTYSFSPVDSGWLPLNGTYDIYIRPTAVFDTSGLGDHFVAEQKLGEVTIAIPADTTAPSVTVVSAPDVTTTGGATYDFTLRYTDQLAVLRSTIDDTDVLVRGPGGILYSCTLVNVSSAVDAPSITATYRLAAPGGSWTVALNGDYTFILAAGAVTDVVGNGIAASSDTGFTVTLDETGPTAVATSTTGSYTLANITTATSADYLFKVRFSDAGSVDVTSITSGSVVVVDGIGTVYALTLVSIDPSGDPDVQVATFSLAYPAGSLTGGWNAVFNGTYTIRLVADGVQDGSGNGSVQTDIGSFIVSVAAAPVSASLTSTPVPAAGSSSMLFSVRFSSADMIQYLSLLSDNIVRVTGPNGYDEAATFQSIDLQADGTTRIATFSIPAPGGSWGYADNGTYRIVIAPGNGVTTAAGGALAAGPFGTFRANFSRVMLVGRVVQIYGTESADTVEFLKDGTRLRVLFNNNTPINYLLSSVNRIEVYGNGGNDTIKVQTTLAKPAHIEGGIGRDTLIGGASADDIYGGSGNDLIRGWGGADSLFGEDGNDTIYGGAGNDEIYGGIGDDRLYGEDGNDTLRGEAGSDVLSGGAGSNDLLS